MLIRWKSGYVRYWIRGVYYLTVGAIVGGVTAYVEVHFFGDYGQVRHQLSTIASIAFFLILFFPFRRRRWYIRFGHQAKWLKAHWLLAGFALTLVFVHSALSPGTWSGWLAFLIALGILLTGLTTHFTKRYTRHYARIIHLSFFFALVGGILVHRVVKLNHPFFPLHARTAQGEIVHDVRCATCHDVRNEYTLYTCQKCHEHATEEIRLAHETHGVPEWSRCLDCHKATIEEKTYATGSGSRFVPGDVYRGKR